MEYTMDDFRKHLLEITGTREFSPLRAGPLLFWIQAGPEYCSTPEGSSSLEDITSWDVMLFSPDGHVVGPGQLPALFAEMSWTRYWRTYERDADQKTSVGEFVPTAYVQQMLDLAEGGFPHARPEPNSTSDSRLQELAARQEEEQREMELEWEVDGKLGFKRFYS
jgi:hypothetical protein